MIEATIAGSALAVAMLLWRWHTTDKQALARRTALRLMAYAEGLDAREAAVKAAMQRKVELV